LGILGSGLVIVGAMQHAPQGEWQFNHYSCGQI